MSSAMPGKWLNLLSAVRWKEIFLVLGALSLCTVLSSGLDLDRRLAAWVWHDGQWPGTTTFPWRQLYLWAPVPALVMVGIALGLLAGGLWRERLRPAVRPALFLVLAVALGPGLTVNTLLKDHWGRARPRELVRFGGGHEFTQVWEPGRAAPNSSFPSGHSAIAFAPLLPWFIWRRRRPKMARLILGAGLLFGGLVGTARILQGAHFLTDVVWSAGIVYLVGALLACILPPPDD